MTTNDFHPLVKQLLDGEVTLADLPLELRAEGAEALRLLAAVDHRPVTLPAAVDARIMAAVRLRAARPSVWHWLVRPREVHLRLRLWTVAPALAAAAALVLFLSRIAPQPAVAPVTVQFVLFAPQAQQVAVAGTFNQWDPDATHLVRSATPGMWTATLQLPAGQHQYAFVVDGARWMPDPTAPAVDDGFGQRNSVISL